MWRTVALAALLGACDGPAGEGRPDARPPAPDAGPDATRPCDPAGVVFGFDLTRAPHELPAGADLPVVSGFQGFLFAQVGLRSSQPLSGPLTVRSSVRIAEGAALSANHPDVPVVAAGGAWETAPVLLFFNDVPLSDLYERPAAVTLAAASAAGCTVTATVAVRLVDGGEMEADAGPLP